MFLDNGNWGDNLTYTLDENGTLNIKGTGDMNDNYQFIIDEEIKVSTKKVILNQGITSIGNGVFSGFSSITEVSIPNSITKIGDNAFRDCYSLVSISIPSSIKEMGFHVFDSCSKLASITISPSLKTINEGTFNGCISLSSIEIPESIESIDLYAFNKCESLTSVKIPKAVKSIGEKAFNNCSNLKSISFYNPECKIFDFSDTICNSIETNNVVIIGYNGSIAEAYAKKYDYNFEFLGEASTAEQTYGDANCDGKVTVADAVAILQFIGNRDKYPLSEDGKKFADVDGVAGITGKDALVIQKVDAGLYKADELPLNR